VTAEDSLCILIDADPDAMASALALKRFFWRQAKRIEIYHINAIQRADNLALMRLLKMELHPVKRLDRARMTRYAVLDSQPHHHEALREFSVDIIIDHHPPAPGYHAPFVDIREQYGANATIMTEYLRAARIKPSAVLATALFYAIKTDTHNFVRGAITNDINAFSYLYRFANMGIIKKIESSEMTKKTLAAYKSAMHRLVLLRNIAFVHMGEVDNPDTLVMMADFFLRLAEAKWSVASGFYDGKLIVIFRNAGFVGDAGKAAQRLFTSYGASAGGHRGAARAEVPLSSIPVNGKDSVEWQKFMMRHIRKLK
jgi:nanoRNase/pAp phosphatase (c-di-AMP/oligoRNAs hydrolase)